MISDTNILTQDLSGEREGHCHKLGNDKRVKLDNKLRETWTEEQSCWAYAERKSWFFQNWKVQSRFPFS